MRLVLDAGLTLAWCFDDQSTPAIDAVMLRIANNGAVVPALWGVELAEGLQTALHHQRIDAAYRDAVFAKLAVLDIRIDPEGDLHVWSTAVPLASQHGLTVAKACYLELAQRRRLPLATLDPDLARAARGMGIPVTP